MLTLVIDVDYEKFLKMQEGKEVKQIILNEKFWNNCLIMVRIMTLLIHLLGICDFDKKPGLGHVYERMHKTWLGIKKLFKNRKHLCKPYTNIINDRWDRMLS